jgi:hypothetical protein
LDSLSTLFHRRLHAHLKSERAAKIDELCKRLPHDDYLFKIGYVKALIDCLEWCDEIQTEIDRAT